MTVTLKQFIGTHAKAAAGVTVTGAGVKAKTNRLGQVRIKVLKVGKLTLHAGGKGYIRAAPLVIAERA